MAISLQYEHTNCNKNIYLTYIINFMVTFDTCHTNEKITDIGVEATYSSFGITKILNVRVVLPKSYARKLRRYNSGGAEAFMGNDVVALQKGKGPPPHRIQWLHPAAMSAFCRKQPSFVKGLEGASICVSALRKAPAPCNHISGGRDFPTSVGADVELAALFSIRGPSARI